MANIHEPQAFTKYGWFACAWILVVSFQAVLTCRDAGPSLDSPTVYYGLPTCIPMSDATFSLLTSVYTVGGLIGSLGANVLMDRWGRKGASRCSSLVTATGAGLMAVSASLFPLTIGRPSMIESPTWLDRHGLLLEKDKAARRIWHSAQGPRSSELPNYDSQDPLLSADDPESGEITPAKADDAHEATLSVPQLLIAPELRRPLTIVCFSMLVQQLSGVNAVLYYSNDILSKALPDLGPYVSLGITIVNFFMTAAPIVLIDRIGRKQLLSLSACGALLSLLGVGFGLDVGAVTLASITILTFIASFAIGIGPVPFVMISEVSPQYAVSALSSVALSLNWIANFLVGLVFLPLRNVLSQGDPEKEGRSTGGNKSFTRVRGLVFLQDLMRNLAVRVSRLPAYYCQIENGTHSSKLRTDWVLPLNSYT
ncbi:predicted protein [Postia placenta Mad-698-R]|nr:predicted protein [Postia placenta Mad-698-R]